METIVKDPFVNLLLLSMYFQNKFQEVFSPVSGGLEVYFRKYLDR